MNIERTFVKSDALEVSSESFENQVVASFAKDISIKENTTSGRYILGHPVIAFETILRGIGGRENKAERDSVEAELIASGVDKNTPAGFKQIDDARKSVKASWDNGRVPVAVLRRLSGDLNFDDSSKPRWNGIRIIEGSDEYKAITKAFKRSVGGFNGHIPFDSVVRICAGLSLVFANAENSSVTAQDLGFMPESMDAFLKGEPLQIAEVIDATEPTENEVSPA